MCRSTKAQREDCLLKWSPFGKQQITNNTTATALPAGPIIGAFPRIHNLGNREKWMLNAGLTYQALLQGKICSCRTGQLLLHLEESSLSVHASEMEMVRSLTSENTTPHHPLQWDLFCFMKSTVQTIHTESGRLRRKSTLFFSNSSGSNSCRISQMFRSSSPQITKCYK